MRGTIRGRKAGVRSPSYTFQMSVSADLRRTVPALALVMGLLLPACAPAAPAGTGGGRELGSRPALAAEAARQAAEPSRPAAPPATPDVQHGADAGAAADAVPGEFSGEAALAHVRHLAGAIGPRAAGSSGAAAAAAYIAEALAAYGYEVERQPFTFPRFEQRAASLTVAGAGADAAAGPARPVEARAMLNSASGRVAGPLVAGGFGRPEDFPAGGVPGAIALIERGAAVTFRSKAEAAARAGAAGAVIFNNAPIEFNGSLQVASPIPVVAISGAAGQELRTLLQHESVTAQLEVDAAAEERATENVVATRRAVPPAGLPGPAGPGANTRPPRTIVVGAHYDSVPVSPGGNDNASGTAVVLELARTLAGAAPDATLRFIAFGGEELGLLGSAYYVQALPPDERARVAAMLNFDMVGVGDTLLVGGDDALVRLVEDAAQRQRLRLGRMGRDLARASDHASFSAAGIRAAFFHVADDPHYHTPDDVGENVSPVRLEQIGRVGAEVIRRLAAP